MKYLSLVVLLFVPSVLLAEDCRKAAESVAEGVALADGTPAEASHYQNAISYCPSMANAYYNLALNFLRRQKFDDAVAQFLKATEKKKDELYFIGLGNAYVYLSKLDQAKSAYDEAIAINPKSVFAYQGLSVVYEAKGNLAEAENVLRKAIAVKDTDPELHYNLGVVLLLAHKYEESIESLKAATGLKADLGKAFLYLGKAYRKLQQYDAAEESLKKAQLLAPKDPDVFVALGNIYDAQGNLDKAAAVMREGLVIDKAHAALGVNYAIVLAKQKKLPESIANLELIVKSAPTNAAAFSALGWVYIQQEAYDKARVAIAKALELDANNAFAHNNLGVLSEISGNKEQAKQSFEKAVSLDPELEEAQENLKRLS